MRRVAFSIAVLLTTLSCGPAHPPRVLLFTKTAAFRHASIPAGQRAILQLGAQHGFVVDTTEDAARITEDSLRQYAAVIFLHTTGKLLTRAQAVDLQRFVQAGGGFVGIHAAADAEYDWRWYGRLVGGYFASHPAIQQATLQVTDTGHASTSHLPREWVRTDEWYNFKRVADGLQVLLSIDETSYAGGTHSGNHPMAWHHAFDGGRAWYTALGHTEESFADSLFLRHVLGGIRYAIGERPRLNYRRATVPRVPPDSSLTKEVLTVGTLEEPTEMAVLPNGDVLIAQRRGTIMLYRDAARTLHPAASLAVYHESGVKGVNAEEGVLGITLDPAFEQNGFVYVFYSPRDSAVNRLSRFTFDDDSLPLASERVILDVPSTRRICCHTGGSLAFGPDRLLFVSTGDNTTPFDEPKERHPSHGFAPIDDRPGHEQYDARRTSANTNDLRGKILRIRVNTDGTYGIPEGNLFPPGTPNTRPEIFVMGNRNPYRLSVDQRRGWLYWGEVGPDAAFDSLDVRGPRGYDEINQARRAGNFGWPLFVGENFPYFEWDYASARPGARFDAAAPRNTSRNNGGLRELPPAQPAFLWYPYGESPDFPLTDKGGRTAMAGPVYHASLVRQRGPRALPAYYDGKLFIYDWMRDWIMAVTLDGTGDYEAMERVVPHEKFASPVDMELGPDGSLYVLEYGKGWFAKNKEAGLSRIRARPAM